MGTLERFVIPLRQDGRVQGSFDFVTASLRMTNLFYGLLGEFAVMAAVDAVNGQANR
jgi:hypothetical protein